MTREDIKKQFPDATDEQISALLDINGNDLTVAKKNNVEPKVLKQLQADSAAYKKLQEAGLSDEEKIQKTLAEAETAKADFQRKSNRLDVEKILVGAGLTEEDYKDLIDGLVSEDADASKTLATSLATMLTKQKDAAVQKTKEELMDGTKKPGDNGGNGGDPDDDDEEESDAAQFAKQYTAQYVTEV